MLNQRRELSQYASQPRPASQPQQPAYPVSAPTVPQTIVQEPDYYAPSPNPYVIPYPTDYYPYYSSYSYWPYYSSYYAPYSYWGPSLSFRFGYGGRGFNHFGGRGFTHAGGYGGELFRGGPFWGGGHFFGEGGDIGGRKSGSLGGGQHT